MIETQQTRNEGTSLNLTKGIMDHPQETLYSLGGLEAPTVLSSKDSAYHLHSDGSGL